MRKIFKINHLVVYQDIRRYEKTRGVCEIADDLPLRVADLRACVKVFVFDGWIFRVNWKNLLADANGLSVRLVMPEDGDEQRL
jgi:hypothetical protein